MFSIVGPKILGKATTELFNGLVAKVNGTGEIDFGKIGMILLWTLGLYVLSACFSFVQGFVMSGISNDVTYNLRKDKHQYKAEFISSHKRKSLAMEPLKSFAFSPDIIRPCPPIGPLLLCSLMPVPPLITEILQSADIPHNLPSVPYEFQCLPYVRRPVQ